MHFAGCGSGLGRFVNPRLNRFALGAFVCDVFGVAVIAAGMGMAWMVGRGDAELYSADVYYEHGTIQVIGCCLLLIGYGLARLAKEQIEASRGEETGLGFEAAGIWLGRVVAGVFALVAVVIVFFGVALLFAARK